jgi:hypothetical protein
MNKIMMNVTAFMLVWVGTSLPAIAQPNRLGEPQLPSSGARRPGHSRDNLGIGPVKLQPDMGGPVWRPFNPWDQPNLPGQNFGPFDPPRANPFDPPNPQPRIEDLFRQAHPISPFQIEKDRKDFLDSARPGGGWLHIVIRAAFVGLLGALFGRKKKEGSA